MEIKKKYKCPCCGYYTLEDEPGHFDICPVCFWEDDNIQSFDPDYYGGANTMSLNEARKTYKKIGAKSKKALDLVRPSNRRKNRSVQHRRPRLKCFFNLNELRIIRCIARYKQINLSMPPHC